LSVGRVINGRLAVRDGRLACDCCGGDGGGDDIPDWVDPNEPGGPGGPGGPTDPGGDPRCCSGDTLCSANDDERIEMGIRIVGTVANDYSYGSGINQGVPFSYSADFNEVFLYQSATNACQMSESPRLSVTVPYRSRSSTSPVDRNIGIQAVPVRWNRERGFYGDQSDTGDSVISNINSGINLAVGSTFASGGAIRGTNPLGYTFNLRVCRSDSPTTTAPVTSRPDTFRLSQPPVTTLNEGTRSATKPNLFCLNRVISDYDETFDVVSGGDTNSIRIQYRFYAVVRRVAPCPLIV
jgi:hypothetical protein